MDFIHSPEEVVVNGDTVGDCLKDFIRQFPGSDKWIFNSQEQFLVNVFIYVNAESTRSVTINDPVKEGDELILVMLLMGG